MTAFSHPQTYHPQLPADIYCRAVFTLLNWHQSRFQCLAVYFIRRDLKFFFHIFHLHSMVGSIPLTNVLSLNTV